MLEYGNRASAIDLIVLLMWQSLCLKDIRRSMVYEHWAIVLKWHFLDLLALLFAMIYFHRFWSTELCLDKEGTFVTRHLLGTSASLIELSAMPRVSAIESLQFTRRCSFIAVSPSITELICNLCSCVVPVVFIDDDRSASYFAIQVQVDY